MLSVQNKALVSGAKNEKAKAFSARTMTISATLVAGLLAGCASNKTDDIETASVTHDYRARHPIVVSESEVVEDVAVSSSKRQLTQRDVNLVLEFARRFKNTGAKSLRIIRPVASRNEHAGRRVSRGLAHELQKAGVPSGAIRHLTYNASEHGDAATVRMSFDALAAAVDSKCGQWEEKLSATKQNGNYQNFGCATQNNLATMVANPADLLGPRGQSPIDATRRDVVIQTWRTGPVGTIE